MPDNVNWFIDDAGLPAYADPSGKVYRPADLTPVPTPDEAPADSTAPAAPEPAVAPGSREGQSSGYSVSGSNTRKVEKAKRGQGTYEQQQLAAAQADESAITDPMASNTQNQIDLVGQEGDIAAQQAQAGVDANLKQAELQRQFAAEDQAAQGVADTQIKKAHAAYLSQVQAYSAMNVNPGQLWGNLSGGNRAQALAAVFASDFLGARGIHTSAMDSLNRAIDENISAQVANINKQGQVAEHFKDLYNMTVSESASDLETRTRMRGFYLAASDKEIQAELAKYDAPMARIKAQEASAALADNFYKSVVIPMYKLTTDRVNDAVRTHMSQTVAEIQAAAERYSADQATKRTQMGIDAAGNQAAAAGSPYMDYNGNAIGWIRPDVAKNPSLVSKLEEKTRNLKNLAVMVTDLKAMIKKYGGTYGGPGQDWLDSLKPEDARRIEQKASAVAYQAALAIHGPRMAKDMVDQFKQQYPIEKWSTNGGVQGVLSDRIIEANNDYQTTLAQNVYAPQSAQDQAALSQYRGLKVGLGPEATEAAVDLSNPFADDSAVDKSMQSAQEPNTDHDAALDNVRIVAHNEAIRNKDPGPLEDAIDQTEAILDAGTPGFSRQKTTATLDALVRDYFKQTGNLPPGKVGDKFRKYWADHPEDAPGKTTTTPQVLNKDGELVNSPDGLGEPDLSDIVPPADDGADTESDSDSDDGS